MNIRETRSGTAVVLALDGKLDGFSAPALETQINRLLSENVKRLVFDCSGLDYISSAGLRVFLATAKQMQDSGGSCAFAALTEDVENVFRLTNFVRLLEIHRTVEDAGS